jgi:putative DNA methylase
MHRKLIEVALPLEAVNAAGRAEKAVPKKGHPATMHLWWSRKPLGVARAVLFASLVDDPSARPDLYPTEAAQHAERLRLMRLIEGLCRWDRSGDVALLAAAQRRIATSAGDDPPRILDPFCGGGAISTEALRLGLDTLAIDLNPVAGLVSAATLSIAQRFAGRPAVHARMVGGSDGLRGIAGDISLYGQAVEAECRRRLARVFDEPVSPHSPSGRTVAVSYLWARTITCANPGCRRTTPLLSTWWLSRKRTNRWHARPVIGGDGFDFHVMSGPPPAELVDLKVGRGANFRCVFCTTLNDADVVRTCGRESGFGLRLVAVQAFADPQRPRGGRIWLAPDAAIQQAGIAGGDSGYPAAVEAALRRELPAECGNVTAFGLRTFGDLLSPRQRRTMATFSEVINGTTPVVHRDAVAAGMPDDGPGLERGGSGARAYAEAITTYLALALSRMANRTTTMTTHNRANGSVEQSFIRPAYGFYGEFPEANPFSGSTGSWAGGLDYVVKAVEALPAPTNAARLGSISPSPSREPSSINPPEPARVGRAEVRRASMLTALDGDGGVVCTDPPYYDMFDYASLSNLFLVWQRATLGDIWADTLGPILAPADEQIVSNAARFGGDQSGAHAHFETLLRRAFKRMRAVQDPRYPLTVYYGYQQVEKNKRNDGASGTAWEALLESLISAGFRITATWPLRTERPEGVKKGTKSLASSVLLVCRPTASDGSDGSDGSGGSVTTVRELRRALRAELPGAVQLLQQADIAPLDLAQAAIGPGMGVYTRYERVLGADGSPLGVRDALALINEVLDETLVGGSAELDADTRWAVTWFDEYGFADGPFGRAEQLSKARNTSVAGLVAAGIVTTTGDRVSLRGRDELDPGWDPATDKRPTAWEATQHLLRTLYDHGEPAAAALLGRLDSDTADAARDLAYRLFRICTRRNRSAEAAACNGLVTSWPELTRLAAGGEQALS